MKYVNEIVIFFLHLVGFLSREDFDMSFGLILIEDTPRGCAKCYALRSLRLRFRRQENREEFLRSGLL